MYQSTTAFGTLVQQDSRTFKCLLTYGETSITTVRSIKFTGGSEGEDDFSLGSTMSQYIEVTIPGKGLVVEGTEMLLQIGMDVNGKTEYIPMGYFTAGKSQKTDDQITFTAYDRMMNTERTFSMNGTTTNTVAVLKKIAEITGVPIVTTGLTAISMKVPKGYSCREVLSYVAQLYGAFAVCNRIGQIELHTYVDSAYKIGAGRYWGNFEHNDYAFNVTRMVCATGENKNGTSISITAGSGTRSISLSNPFMTQAVLNKILASFKNFSYMPGTLKMLGDPRLDPWDILTVTDLFGNTYKVPIMKLDWEYDGGLTYSVEAVGLSEEETNADYKGPQTKEMERYYAQLVGFKVGEILYIRDFKIEEGTQATTWTPAPEDVDNKVSTANTNASNAVSTANTANSTANTAKSTADAAKSSAASAVSTANTANSTANTAKTTASNAASTANTAKSTADSANNKIDNLKIGGRNLIPVGMIKNNGLSTFSYDKASNTWTCVAQIGSNSWGRGIYFDTGVKKIYIPRGYTYIISLEVNPEVACIWNDDVNNGFDGMPNGTGNDNDNTSLRKSSDRSLVANKWQRVWFSYTPRTDVLYDIFDASSNWGIITTDAKSPIKFKIRNVKGEFGTVPTDWTPAPEDVDNKIDTAQKSADNANSSVNALNKIATKSYSFGGANGKAQWVRLGTLTSAGDASVVVITLQTGNGFNGTESQNSQAEIIIKDGWQDKASTTAAFGASVTRQNTKDLLVSVRATASNVCEVWTYLPWLYWNGNYTISGIYSGWNPNFTKQDTKPTNGVEQSLAYRTTAEDAYTLASGLKKDVDISSEFVKTYNDWAFKWKTATMVDGAEVGTYQKYITLESGNILLGHSNSKNKLKITNDSIQFKGTSDTAITPDSDATAWITGKVFHINSGEIESSLKFGKVLMKPTKNGIQIGNKAEFGERVRIGYPLSSNMQYTYSDCPLVVGSNTNTIGDYPWFAVDDGYAFVRNGIITPGDFIIKFGEYTLDRPNGGKFSGTLRPYYRADDVINMEFYVNGYVTSNKQEVIFHIPLSRPIMSTPVSISSINGLTIRQNGKYIYNSTASKPIKPASYTAAVIGGRNGLNVRAKMRIDSNGFTDTDIKNIVNNDTCAIMASIKITF